jgi:glycosyltransferase involved in cell wall biosynthesis
MTFQLGIDDLVIFIGRVENSKLAEYLNVADVYVSTALSDAGIAASTAEAMSCELPCVITNVRENSYWIEDSVNGFLFEARNYKELAVKIRIIIENPTIGGEFGKKARAKILDSNDYYSEMKKAENLYLESCMN